MVVAGILFVTQLRAAEITRVQSSFDKDDPFDISLRINYEYSSEKAEILREGLQTTDPLVEMYNKLKWERTFQITRFHLAIGVFRDLEVFVDLPLVVSDRGDLGFHPALPTTGGEPYSVAIRDIDNNPAAFTSSSTGAAPLFDVPFSGKTRTGLGDVGFGVRWAPWHNARDRQYPSWVIGLLVRLPTADIKRADNTAVGEGLYQVEFNTAISRRVTPFFEPYFDVHGLLRIASEKSLFDDLNSRTQTLVKPGNSMGMKFGADFKFWENPVAERFVSLDVGAGLDYVFEGREYTELFEAFGSSPCNYANAAGTCDRTVYSSYVQNVLQKPKDQGGGVDAWNAAARMDAPRSDGITDVEHYGIYHFWAGLQYQPVKYFAAAIKFNLAYVQPHYITFADAGKDAVLDLNEGVDGYNSLGENEYNPKYVEEWDRIGQRFKTTNKLRWGLVFQLTGQF
jgi:hypothetical protein